MGTTYPYPLPLAELDRFTPSDLELLVAGNPSFQYLRGRGWPFRWAELVTGKRFDANRANDLSQYVYKDQAADQATQDTEAGPLLPAQAGELVDAFGLERHLRSLLVLTAKVRRDGKDERDQVLLRDLGFWIDQPGYPYSEYGFRWERHYQDLMKQQKQQAWHARVDELQQGEAHVVAILRHRLNDQEMERIQAILEEQHFGFPPSGKGTHDQAVQRDLHFPYLQCLQCSLILQDSYPDRRHAQVCFQKNAFLVIDSGKDSDILSHIPRPLRALSRIARFTVPRWTFRAPFTPGDDAIFPRLIMISMEQMDRSQQDAVYEKVRAWVALQDEADEQWRQNNSPSNAGKGIRNQVLLRPVRSRSLNALVIAGPYADQRLWEKRPTDDRDVLGDLLKSFPVCVSTIRTASQGALW